MQLSKDSCIQGQNLCQMMPSTFFRNWAACISYAIVETNYSITFITVDLGADA